MSLLLQSSPLLAIALCAGFGIDPLRAVAIALALALPAAAVGTPAGDLLPVLIAETARGAWLALTPVAITVAGLLFHAAVSAHRSGKTSRATRGHAGLFDACLLLGPFFETITGFSVGVVFALSDLRALGVVGSLAGALALFSQVLIPWGGLGPGTAVGAALAGVEPAVLGACNAWLSAAWLLALLPLFWRLARAAGLAASRRERAEEALVLLALGGLLIAASQRVGIEAAGLLALGPPLLWRLRSALGRREAWRTAAPYVALSAIVIGTRLIPLLEQSLRSTLFLRPWPDLPPIAPFHHPASLMLMVTLTVLAPLPARCSLVVAAVRRAFRPAALFLAYGILARLLGGSGAAAAVAGAAAERAGLFRPVLVPLFAAAGGFFTGTNVGSNALMMPIQTELAAALGLPVALVAAVQNFTGSAFCLVAPMRLGVTAALAGEGAAAGAIGRLIRPAAGLGLAVAAAAIAAALLVRAE